MDDEKGSAPGADPLDRALAALGPGSCATMDFWMRGTGPAGRGAPQRSAVRFGEAMPEGSGWRRWSAVAVSGPALRAAAARDPFGAVDAVLDVLCAPGPAMRSRDGAEVPFGRAFHAEYGDAMDALDRLAASPADFDVAFAVRCDLRARAVLTGPFMRAVRADRRGKGDER